MTFPGEFWPWLKEHNLNAFIINEGWTLIKRKNYIDLYVDDEPHTSVEVLFHAATSVSTLIRANMKLP